VKIISNMDETEFLLKNVLLKIVATKVAREVKFTSVRRDEKVTIDARCNVSGVNIPPPPLWFSREVHTYEKKFL